MILNLGKVVLRVGSLILTVEIYMMVYPVCDGGSTCPLPFYEQNNKEKFSGDKAGGRDLQIIIQIILLGTCCNYRKM